MKSLHNKTCASPNKNDREARISKRRTIFDLYKYLTNSSILFLCFFLASSEFSFAQQQVVPSQNQLDFFPVANGNHMGFRTVGVANVNNSESNEFLLDINGGRTDLRSFDCNTTVGYISSNYFNIMTEATFIDYDGDGTTDIIGGRNGAPGLFKMKNAGSGFAFDGYITGLDNVSRGEIHAFDSDGDGDQDFIVQKFNTSPILMVNDGAGNFTIDANAQFPVFSDIYDIQSADLDNDGDLDLVMGYYNWPHSNIRPSVYRNDGNNVFTGVWPTVPGYTWYIYSMSIGDVDGNGYLDLFFGGTRDDVGDKAFLYLNNGNFDFDAVNISDLIPNQYRYTSGAFGDFDGDGVDEFVTSLNMPADHVYGGTYSNGKSYYGYPAIFKWNGTGFDKIWEDDPYTQANNAWKLIDGAGFVDAVDMDNDTRLDLVAHSGNGFIYLNSHDLNECGVPPIQKTEQTLTILGGYGNQGDVDPYTDASRDGGQTWQPAFLTGWHPWGFAAGTNSWINFDPSPFVGLNTTTDYRIRFNIPADYENPQMTFTIKADNRAWLSINGTFVSQFDGQNSGAAGDQVMTQALHAGINEITIRLQDFGGWVGLNYRIDITMLTAEDLTDAVQPSESSSNTKPVADAGADQTFDCIAQNVNVTFDGSASSDADGDALTYSWTQNGTEVSTDASFSATVGGGVHTYSLTVSDGSATSTDDVVVTVNLDEIPPTLALPDNISAGNDSTKCGALVEFSAGASDACGEVSIVSEPASGSFFPVGETTVTVTATDGAGNTATGTFLVSVADTESPVITVAGNNPMEIIRFTGYSEAGASVVDNCTADLSAAVSGTVDVNLPGSYTITYSAEDDAGNSSTVSRTVNVINDPEALTNPFLFLAEKEIEVDKSGNSLGDVHSNGEIELKKGPALFTGNLTALKKIELKRDVTVDGNVTGARSIKIDKRASVSGAVTDHGNVDYFDLPVLGYAPVKKKHGHDVDRDDDYKYSSLGEKIRVRRGQSLELAPGSYSEVEVQKGGTLVISTGEYLIGELKLQKEAYLTADIATGPITVNVVKKAEFQNKTSMSILPLGEIDSRYVTINSLKEIKVGEGSKIFASLVAPYGDVKLKKNVYFRGAIAAEEIEVDKESSMLYHNTGDGITTQLTAAIADLGWESIQIGEEPIPQNFELMQNYPNPFNPTTTISYSIPEASYVSLKVYDMLGKEVATLVENNVQAGFHSVTFDASNLASGLYIYRLQSENFLQTNKMILNK